MTEIIIPPIAMLAELTHRCPLQCIYCSNPIELLKANKEMDTNSWLGLFDQAADLGVLQVHISGGEPTLRPDLDKLIAGLVRRGVYTNLITAGVGLSEQKLKTYVDAGLDHVQLSFQGATAKTTELVGNNRGAYEQKLETARLVREAGLPLTINAPVHRHNMNEVSQFIEMALSLGAERLEIANVQYAGWALANRKALMPEKDAIERMVQIVEEAQKKFYGIMTIDFVAPDYYAIYPKPCMGGWARDAFMVAPDGRILPCHAAGTIKSLTFEHFGDRPLADIWRDSPAFNAFRGTDWMKEPCRSCERKEIDWGGCRCQAMAIAGDASETDPACVKSPFHDRMEDLVKEAVSLAAPRADGFTYRRIGAQSHS